MAAGCWPSLPRSATGSSASKSHCLPWPCWFSVIKNRVTAVYKSRVSRPMQNRAREQADNTDHRLKVLAGEPAARQADDREQTSHHQDGASGLGHCSELHGAADVIRSAGAEIECR